VRRRAFNPDDGAESFLQKWRIQEDQRDHEEAKRHRRGDVLIELPV
jgi:hypothetical protein